MQLLFSKSKCFKIKSEINTKKCKSKFQRIFILYKSLYLQYLKSVFNKLNTEKYCCRFIMLYTYLQLILFLQLFRETFVKKN